MGKPSIYPTGVTIYNKEKAYNGFNLYESALGATLVDMNGRIVKLWSGVHGNPVKPLPGGQILASAGTINKHLPGASCAEKMLQVDWDGNVVWSYYKNKEMKDENGNPVMASCHHHDFEREGTASGCYTPASEPKKSGKTILLTHNHIYDLRISDKLLLDERIIEIDEDGKLLWEWNASEHLEEYGLSDAARRAMSGNPTPGGDWIHLNAVSTLGPNRHYDSGDWRFAPDNLICSSRQFSELFIIDKRSGKLVWRLGPDFSISPELRRIGQIIGQHQAHMIPAGLPGEGNILVFDNGSFGGFGAPDGVSPDGTNNLRRHYSRVLEIDPVTYELKWEYVKGQRDGEQIHAMSAGVFFSAFISGAQRLPNGNTLITQGADGIVQEVTPEKTVVWEYVNPIRNRKMPPLMQTQIYRTYRIPYEWVPQLEVPEEVDVLPPDIDTYRVPGSFPLGDPAAVETKIQL